jgi:hypothetical protein
MKLERKKNLPDCLGPKLLRQKKFIGSILKKVTKIRKATPLGSCVEKVEGSKQRSGSRLQKTI